MLTYRCAGDARLNMVFPRLFLTFSLRWPVANLPRISEPGSESFWRRENRFATSELRVLLECVVLRWLASLLVDYPGIPPAFLQALHDITRRLAYERRDGAIGSALMTLVQPIDDG